MFGGERERVSKHSPLAPAGMAYAVFLFLFPLIEARQDFAGDVQLLWVAIDNVAVDAIQNGRGVLGIGRFIDRSVEPTPCRPTISLGLTGI